MAGLVLRVLARGTASVPLHGAHARGMSRFVGRVDDYELGKPFVSIDETGIKTPGIAPARVCSGEPTTIAQDSDPVEFNEQLLHLRYGDLWPFDQETAGLARVPFDPEYGGEYVKSGGKLVNVAHRDALAALVKAKTELPATPAAPPPPASFSTRPTPTPAPSAQEK